MGRTGDCKKRQWSESYHNGRSLLTLNSLPTVEAAEAYMTYGWSPIPTRNDEPLLTNWDTAPLTPQQLGLFHNADIGLGLGQISRGLYVVNIDAPEAIRLAPSYLSPTRAVSWRPGMLFRHYFYQTADPVYRNKYLDVDGVLLLELRSDGQQILAAPSKYGEYSCVLWEDEGPPAEIDAFRLVEAADRLAAVTLLARHWNQAWRQGAGPCSVRGASQGRMARRRRGHSYPKRRGGGWRRGGGKEGRGRLQNAQKARPGWLCHRVANCRPQYRSQRGGQTEGLAGSR